MSVRIYGVQYVPSISFSDDKTSPPVSVRAAPEEVFPLSPSVPQSFSESPRVELVREKALHIPARWLKETEERHRLFRLEHHRKFEVLKRSKRHPLLSWFREFLSASCTPQC